MRSKLSSIWKTCTGHKWFLATSWMAFGGTKQKRLFQTGWWEKNYYQKVFICFLGFFHNNISIRSAEKADKYKNRAKNLKLVITKILHLVNKIVQFYIFRLKEVVKKEKMMKNKKRKIFVFSLNPNKNHGWRLKKKLNSNQPGERQGMSGYLSQDTQMLLQYMCPPPTTLMGYRNWDCEFKKAYSKRIF